MWIEFERFVRAHATSSPMHQKILDCLIECKKLPSEATVKTPDDPFDRSVARSRTQRYLLLVAV